MSRRLLMALALLLLAADLLMQMKAANAGDKNWLLYAAGKVLSGERRLDIDIIEINPPLIIWLYMLPVAAARALPQMADFIWLALMGFALVAFVIALCMRLTALHPAFASKPARQAQCALLLAYVLIFFSQQVYFLDRDHLMFVLIFPYLMRFLPGIADKEVPRGLRLAVGVMAALGFCIKPHALILFALLQLYGIWRRRSLAPLASLENLCIYAFALAYLAAMALFAPDYLRIIAPMAAQTYGAYSRRINGYLFLAIAFISAGLTFVDFRPRHATPYRRDVYYLILLNLAFMLYALAGNGWGYTYNPLLCMLLFTSGWVAWEYAWLRREYQARGLSVRSFTFGLRACWANLIVNAGYMTLYIGAFFLGTPCGRYGDCHEYGDYTAYLYRNHVHSFATLSMNLRRWTAIARLPEMQWDTRFNHLWMLPGVMRKGQGDPSSQWITAYVSHAYGEDLERWRPEAVFVDISDGIFNYPHAVDMLAVLGADPLMQQAWSRYRFDATIDQCPPVAPSAKTPPMRIDCRFAVYRRLPQKGPAP